MTVYIHILYLFTPASRSLSILRLKIRIMSITVAVNATDSTNGPQAVCQSEQHNNCGEYNGGGGDDDDMAVFDHEKDHQEQLKKDCKNHLNHKDKNCCYDFQDLIDKELNEDKENLKWEAKWNSLMSYIRTVYRMAMDGVEVERYPPHNIFKEAAYESKSCDSYHVFQNVENLVMEFVLEARARQVQILEKKNKDTPELPQVFVFCLLDSYRRLMAATDHLKDVIKPIEEYHLSKFNLSWRMMNQYLYHSRLYADRTIYHLVTTFIEQILSLPILSKSLLSASLIHDYTKFVKEVKLNISEWAEARTCIHNIKCNEVWAMGAKKYKETMLKEVDGLFPPSPPANDDLVIDLSIPTPPQSPAPEYQEREENDNCGGTHEERNSNYCDCSHDPPTVDSRQNSSGDYDIYAHNEICSNLQENVELNSLTFSYSNMKEKMLCFYSGETLTDEDEKPVLIGNISKHLGKKVLNSDDQLKPKPISNVKCPSNNDKNVTCKVDPEQLPKRRYPYPHVTKSEPVTKPNNRPLHGHSCHKHTEHVKRVHNHDEASECSSGRSSQDDSCSERSTSSPRQCDCCYCEVFGHGVPSVAPVSRNYQEMRDRLRNLYLLKKAKQNVHPLEKFKPQPKDGSQVVYQVPLLPRHFSQTNDKNGTIKGVQQKKMVEPISTANVINEKTKLKKDSPQGLFDKPIDELVNFIEGNKATNEKRAAKKARRREKKEELERIKKEEEEAERKRIEEEERKKQKIERLKREEALKKEKKKGKNQNKQQKPNQQPKQITNSKTPQSTKQQLQQNTQSSKKTNKQSHGNTQETVLTKKDEKCKKDNMDSAKMVTIKRDSDSSKVTITFRGAVEDDVLCTLYDNEAIKAIQRLCDKSKQPQEQIEEKSSKKRSRNRKKKQTVEPIESPLNPKPVESVLITNKNIPKLPPSMKWYCSSDVNITPVPSTTSNSIQPQPNTVLIKRTNNNQVFTRQLPPSPSQAMPLTSPTAIQINEAVNKISSSSAPIDIENLQLPPGITITKLDPSDYKPPRDIQQATEKAKPSPLQFPFTSPAAVTPYGMQQNAQNNVVVVKTDGYDYEGTSEWSGAASKRHRRRKKVNGCNLDDTNTENIQPGFTISNKSSTRDACSEEGKTIAGQIPTNTPRAIPLPVIIQRHGGMVTIRNPLYQRNDDAILTETNDSQVNGGDDDDANQSGKRRRRRRRVKGGSKQTDVEESVFEPKDIDLENGEMDADERELEAFKRFCLQSVPPQRKEKVHLNIKDIVMKKKSTAAAAAAAVGCV